MGLVRDRRTADITMQMHCILQRGGVRMPKRTTDAPESMDPNNQQPASTKPPRSPGRPRRQTVVRSGRQDSAELAEAPILASRVTARSQTTLPSGVRKALGLRAGDQIAYEIEKDRVVIRRVGAGEEEDPALGGFLDLLESDIARNKDRTVFATEGFARYLEDMTAGIEVDYDAAIEGDFQL